MFTSEWVVALVASLHVFGVAPRIVYVYASARKVCLGRHAWWWVYIYGFAKSGAQTFCGVLFRSRFPGDCQENEAIK